MHEQAIPYLTSAARCLGQRFAPTEQCWCYQRIRWHYHQLPSNTVGECWKQRAVALNSLGDIYRGLGACDSEVEAKEEGFSVVLAHAWKQERASPEPCHADIRAHALTQLVWAYAYAGRFGEAKRTLQSYHEFLSDDVSLETQLGISSALGFTHYRMQDWSQAEAFFRQGLELAEQAALPDQVQRFASYLQCVYRRSGDYPALRRFCQVAVDALRQPNGDLTYTGHISCDHLGWLNGDLNQCIHNLRQALLVADEWGLVAIDDCYSRLCLAYRLVDARKAVAYADEAMRILKLKGRRDSQHFLATKGLLHLELGELDEARRCMTELEQWGTHPCELATEIALVDGDWQTCLRELILYEEQLHRYPFRAEMALSRHARFHRLHGMAQLGAGSQLADNPSGRTEAHADLDAILTLIGTGGMPPDLGIAYGECLQLALSLGETQEAQSYYSEARKILEACGATWYVERLTRLWDQAAPGRTQEVVKEPAGVQRVHQPLSICLFGRFEIHRKGIPVPDEEWRRSRKARNVLKYLLLQCGRPVMRDVLFELFLRDTPVERASLNLNTLIHIIRNILEPDRPRRAASSYLLTEAEAHRLDTGTDVWLDITAFEDATRQAKQFQQAGEMESAVDAWRQASQIYRGELLPENRYEDWCTAEREQLRNEYVRCLLQLAEYHYREDQLPASEDFAQRILAQDSLHEVALRLVMRCLARQSRHHEALACYRHFSERLWDEMACRPEAQTTSLYEGIQVEVEQVP